MRKEGRVRRLFLSLASRLSSSVSAFVRRRRAALGGVIIATLLLQLPLRRALDRAAQNSAPEVLYISSGRLLRRLSLGFNGLLADIYWTRAVQYYGREVLSQQSNFELLGPLLRVTTALDPHLLVAYRFGAIFLAAPPPDGAGKPQEAMHLLRRGIVGNPDYWRLWEDLGFIEYWDLRDYAAAARIFRTGSERPGAEVWMRTLAASVAAKGGEIQTSRLLWIQIYQTADNEVIRKSALAHLAALKAYQDIQEITRILGLYERKEGRPARSIQELVNAGFLRSAPLDPSGVPYKLGESGEAELGPGSAIDLPLAQ